MQGQSRKIKRKRTATALLRKGRKEEGGEGVVTSFTVHRICGKGRPGQEDPPEEEREKNIVPFNQSKAKAAKKKKENADAAISLKKKKTEKRERARWLNRQRAQLAGLDGKKGMNAKHHLHREKKEEDRRRAIRPTGTRETAFHHLEKKERKTVPFAETFQGGGIPCRTGKGEKKKERGALSWAKLRLTPGPTSGVLNEERGKSLSKLKIEACRKMAGGKRANLRRVGKGG